MWCSAYYDAGMSYDGAAQFLNFDIWGTGISSKIIG